MPQETMPIRLILPRKVAVKLREKAPVHKWGELLEQVFDNINLKNLDIIPAPQDEEVVVDFEIPKKTSRKISNLAELYDVKWADIIWSALHSNNAVNFASPIQQRKGALVEVIPPKGDIKIPFKVFTKKDVNTLQRNGYKILRFLEGSYSELPEE